MSSACSLPDEGRGAGGGRRRKCRKIKGAREKARLRRAFVFPSSLAPRLVLPPHRAHARLYAGVNHSRPAGHLSSRRHPLRHAGRGWLSGVVNRLAGHRRRRMVFPVLVHDAAMFDVAVMVAVTDVAAMTAGAAAAVITAAAGATADAAAVMAAGITGDGVPQPQEWAGSAAARAYEVRTLIARIAAVRRVADPLAPVMLAATPARVAPAIQPVLDAAAAIAAGQARSAGSTRAAGAAARVSAVPAMVAAFDAAAWLADQAMAERAARPHAATTGGRKKCDDNRRQGPFEHGCSFRAFNRGAPNRLPQVATRRLRNHP